MVNVSRDGGVEDGEHEMNMMQMLHGCYNIQNWHKIEELKDIWKYTADKECTNLEFRKLEGPVLSRWWLVGACTTSFEECKEVWDHICGAMHNSSPSSSASNKIAYCTLNLIKKPVIINDLELLIAIYK